MVEKSPLTVTKAIYIYRRCLLTHVGLLAARESLGRRRSAKSRTAYFDTDVVVDVSKDVIDAADWRAFVVRYWAFVDAAWLVCVAARPTGIDQTSAVAHLADVVSRLIAKSTRILFDKAHKLRHLPDCPLLDACAHQILQDILILQLLLLVCFCLDPRAAVQNAQGNALLDIVAAPYVLDDTDDHRLPSVCALLEPADQAADDAHSDHRAPASS